MAGVRDQRRSGLRHGRRTRVAARVVWREGLFPLAGIEGLQNARAGVAVALSRVHDLPRVQRGAVSAGGVVVSGGDAIEAWREKKRCFRFTSPRPSPPGRGGNFVAVSEG